jgi:hypothetical protein
MDAPEVVELEVLDGPFRIGTRGDMFVVMAPEGYTTKAQIIGNQFKIAGEVRTALGVESHRATFYPSRLYGIGILFAPAS